jgi:hypothetical protein
MRQITGAVIAMAAACGLGAVALANIPAAGHSAPPGNQKTHHPAGRPPVQAAPSYVTVSGPTGTAIVRRTSTGAKLATVRPPHGASFIGVGGSQDDRSFVLAAHRSAGTQLYLLLLNQHGQPKRPLVKLSVPPLPAKLGDCPAELAGLAVGPADGGVVAASMLSYCPTGKAGPGEILTARISSGHMLATFHPGNGYPMWLSWTQAGSLAYDWSSSTTGVFVIPEATKSSSKARLLISNSASVGGFSQANYPMITLDGSTVLATVGRGSDTFAIAAFSANGKPEKLISPSVRNPAKFCGPLWTDSSGRRLLVGCGDGAEFEVQNGKITKLHGPWQLPAYPTPGAPLIAW